MEIVTTKIAKNFYHNHLIFFIPEDPSTYAASVLLNDYYRDLDISYSENDDWRYLFIVKRTFLRHQKKDSKWICHYCGKEIFKMALRNKRTQNITDCVTIDHKVPACKCEDKTDSTNFLVCCHKCNQKKDSVDYDNFIKRHTHGNNNRKNKED